MEDRPQELRHALSSTAATTGAQVLVDLLRAQGVEYVFGIPGATEIRFMEALEQASDLRYILGLHKVVCEGMAEGYARATGRPGFLNLHTAPGLAAALPLLYNARLGRVPLVVTVGQNDTRLLQRDPHLTGDIAGMGALQAKWSTELVHADDLPVVIRRAFKMAVQAPAGPVVVSLPQNVLEQECRPLVLPDPPGLQIVSGSGGRPTGDTCLGRPRADRDAIAAAARLLAGARAPLFLVESGVARSKAVQEVVRLAELTGARVYQAWMSDVNFPVSHPLYLGDIDLFSPEAAAVLATTDVLVGIGCQLFAHGFLPGEVPLPAGLRLIHIDDDPWEIGKNLPTDCGLLGDIKATVAELNEVLEAQREDHLHRSVEQRTATIARQKQAAVEEWESLLASAPRTTPLPIPRLMAELARALEPGTVIVDEAWSASAALRRTLPLDTPVTFFRFRSGGSIGAGLPLALGVQLGLPEREVVAVVGDGSAAWSIQSLWTAARYQIPVTFVITNNAAYRQVKLVRRAVLGEYPLDERHEGMDLDRPVIDFSLLAQALGVAGTRVTQAAEVGEALRQARATGGPHLVEVMVENAPT